MNSKRRNRGSKPDSEIAGKDRSDESTGDAQTFFSFFFRDVDTSRHFGNIRTSKALARSWELDVRQQSCWTTKSSCLNTREDGRSNKQMFIF